MNDSGKHLISGQLLIVLAQQLEQYPPCPGTRSIAIYQKVLGNPDVPTMYKMSGNLLHLENTELPGVQSARPAPTESGQGGLHMTESDEVL